ncbi:MAG: hypothetical protein ACYC8T_00795 [Myxococcaceae bacterium]
MRARFDGWVLAAALALALVGAAGCPPKGHACSADEQCSSFELCDVELGVCGAKQCTKDSDCGAEARCAADGFCAATGEGDGGDRDGGGDGGDAGPECSPACAAWSECVAAACVQRYASVTWASPASGTRAGAGPVALAAQLATGPGRSPNDPSELTFTWDGGATGSGTLSRVDAGYYTGAWTAPGEGGYALVARFVDAGLSSAPLALVVDRTGPVFTVTVPTPPARPDGGPALASVDVTSPTAWRRDEKVLVQLSSAASDVAASTVTLSVAGTDGGVVGPLAVQPATGCGQPYCGTVEVDLSKPALNAFRSSFALAVGGQDAVGNAGVGSGGVAVTRWKWSYDVGAPVKTSPAIGKQGAVYFGTVGGLGNTGTLYALNPDGTPKWAFDAGAVEASPAVGLSDAGVETVFVAATNPTGAALFALGSGGGLLQECPYSGQSKASLAAAELSVGGETLVSAVGVFSRTSGNKVAAIRPGATNAADRCILSPDVGTSTNGQADFPSTVSMKGGSAFYGDKAGRLQGYTFASGGWSVSSGTWPVDVSLFTRGLGIPSTGMDVVGGGGGPGQGGVFRVPFTGAVALPWKYPSGPSSPAWSPAIAPGDAIFFGDDSGTLSKVTLNASTASATVATSGPVNGAPAVGGDGAVYTVDSTGELAAWTSGLVRLWSETGLGTVESSPSLDCARGASGTKLVGRPGVLYVGSSTTGKLYSFVVDSRGIDTTAPWPKYQHDPRNTGNSSTAMTEFTCP